GRTAACLGGAATLGRPSANVNLRKSSASSILEAAPGTMRRRRNLLTRPRLLMVGLDSNHFLLRPRPQGAAESFQLLLARLALSRMGFSTIAISFGCEPKRPTLRDQRRRRVAGGSRSEPRIACSSRLPSFAARSDARANRGVAVIDRAGEIVGRIVGQLRRSVCRAPANRRWKIQRGPTAGAQPAISVGKNRKFVFANRVCVSAGWAS